MHDEALNINSYLVLQLRKISSTTGQWSKYYIDISFPIAHIELLSLLILVTIWKWAVFVSSDKGWLWLLSLECFCLMNLNELLLGSVIGLIWF